MTRSDTLRSANGAFYEKASEPEVLVLMGCFLSLGVQMWNTRMTTAIWWVSPLCSLLTRMLSQQDRSLWVTLPLCLPLDFTRFGSISRCARKKTSREAQVQSKRNVSDKAAVDQGTRTASEHFPGHLGVYNMFDLISTEVWTRYKSLVPSSNTKWKFKL